MSPLAFTRRLVSQDEAAIIARPDVPRSKFLNAWTRKSTFDQGLLVPFLVDEVLPGDHLKYDVTAYLRMATPLFPVFDNLQVDTFFFFTPNRLVWANFQRFMGEQANPADSIAFTVPQNNSPLGGYAVGSVYDHLGLPCVGQIVAGQGISVNALPIRMYSLIYNAWFRDQNLINSLPVSTGDGPDSGVFDLLRRAKAHDYFTSALPWPQKFTAPTVPLTGTAPITGIGAQSTSYTPGPTNFTETGGAVVSYPFFQDTATVARFGIRGTSAAGGQPQIFANLSAATASFAINTMRQAFLVQQMLERDARGGTRYIEIVKSHFGVTSLDARLDRPEYIGGGSSPIVITPIAQTAPVAGSGLGILGAAGTSAGQHNASYASTEHGYIIGIINVRSELSYQQGINRLWRRSTRNDFYWPSLSGLGEQAVLREELYATGVDADDTTVFGYQERWQEYRTRTSEVTGLFRSTSAGMIDQWHLAQRFTVPPVLGQTFIEDSAPMARILPAVSTNMQFLADILIRREATRPIPMFGTPVMLGRF